MDAVAFIHALQEAANAHDASRLGEYYADDAVAVSPVFGEVQGREAVVKSFERLFQTFPDSNFTLSDIIAGGERIAFMGSVTATDGSGWFGLTPTGTRVSYRMTVLLTLEGEQIVRDERLYDMTGVVERLEKARLDRELATAADVQTALLPGQSRHGSHWSAVADSIPCRAIGGDFFEISELPSGDLAIALGDVEGKGTPAALVGAMLHGMFVSDAQTGLGPAATLTKMNRQLAATTAGVGELSTRQKGSRFASLVYGVLSPGGRFVYANAGHSRPALLTGGDVVRLPVGGPLLGAFPKALFTEGETRLTAGDTLLMFSDGASDARNSLDDDLGEERVIAAAQDRAGCAPEEILDKVLQTIREFVGETPPSDDVTVAVARLL